MAQRRRRDLHIHLNALEGSGPWLKVKNPGYHRQSPDTGRCLAMCGRFSLKLPMEELLTYLDAEAVEISPRYNIAPTKEILIYRVGPEGRRQLAPVRWGLIPAWVDTLPTGAPLINARCETVASKPSFREAFRSRRCLIPATGFYEWKKDGRKRLPFHIIYRDGRLMFLAGVWDRWKNPQYPEQIIDSCAIITTKACPEVEPLHDRMPSLIQEDSFNLWLDGDPDAAASLLALYPGRDLHVTPANPVMNSATAEGPECHRPPQGKFF